MQKLYKLTDGDLYYHEAWKDKENITEHWGKVGERGETRDHKVSGNTIDSVLAPAIKSGFEPVEAEHVLMVEYSINGMGNKVDLKKRHELESELNELLGWTGLGNCDGGSIGSGTMEVCCFVVDFSLAKRVIEEKLRGTTFGDYLRIYEEE